jgi:hypothetical protein
MELVCTVSIVQMVVDNDLGHGRKKERKKSHYMP